MTDHARWTEHQDSTESDIVSAWAYLDAFGGGTGEAITTGLMMLQSIARSLAVLADEAEERRSA